MDKLNLKRTFKKWFESFCCSLLDFAKIKMLKLLLISVCITLAFSHSLKNENDDNFDLIDADDIPSGFNPANTKFALMARDIVHRSSNWSVYWFNQRMKIAINFVLILRLDCSYNTWLSEANKRLSNGDTSVGRRQSIEWIIDGRRLFLLIEDRTILLRFASQKQIDGIFHKWDNSRASSSRCFRKLRLHHWICCTGKFASPFSGIFCILNFGFCEFASRRSTQLHTSTENRHLSVDMHPPWLVWIDPTHF